MQYTVPRQKTGLISAVSIEKIIMKKINVSASKRLLPLLLIITQLNVWGQDKTVTSAVNKTTNFLEENWLWVAGAVVLLLILIGIFSGSNKRRVITKTTVIKEEKQV
jgi:hypothetical protein